jgi:DNA-binding IclR family transcriptional regulator
VSSLEALDLLSQDEKTGRCSLGVKRLHYGAAYYSA